MALLLSAKELEGMVSMPEALAALEKGFIEYFKDRCDIPIRMIVGAPERAGRYVVLPCYLADSDIFHIKTFSIYLNNPKSNLPPNYYYYFLHDTTTGKEATYT